MISSVKQSLNLICLLLISATAVSAQVGLKGRVLDAETKQVVSNVHVIEGGNLEATITDAKGNFTLEPERFPTTLTFSHIAYETRSVMVHERPGRPLEVLLIPKQTLIREVVVEARKLEAYFEHEIFGVSDYALWGNFVFILGYQDRVAAKMQLRVSDYSGRVLAKMEVPKRSKLFKDAFGNIHLFSDSTIDQLYFDGDSLKTLYSVARSGFEAALTSIIYQQDGFSVQKTEDDDHLLTQYFLFNLQDSARNLLHSSYDHRLFQSWQQAQRFRFGSIPDVRFGQIKKTYGATFDPTDPFTNYSQDRLLTYIPIVSQLFAWDDSWIILENDGPRCTTYSYDGAFTDSTIILMDGQTSKHDFMQDELTGNIYLSYLQNSQLTISKFDPETASPGRSMTVPAHRYAEKIRIHQGRVFFLDLDAGNDGIMRLYSIPFKANN